MKKLRENEHYYDYRTLTQTLPTYMRLEDDSLMVDGKVTEIYWTVKGLLVDEKLAFSKIVEEALLQKDYKNFKMSTQIYNDLINLIKQLI